MKCSLADFYWPLSPWCWWCNSQSHLLQEFPWFYTLLAHPNTTAHYKPTVMHEKGFNVMLDTILQNAIQSDNMECWDIPRAYSSWTGCCTWSYTAPCCPSWPLVLWGQCASHVPQDCCPNRHSSQSWKHQKSFFHSMGSMNNANHIHVFHVTIFILTVIMKNRPVYDKSCRIFFF